MFIVTYRGGFSIFPVLSLFAIFLSVYQFICLSLNLSICLSISISHYLSICLYVQLVYFNWNFTPPFFYYFSICLSVCLTISVSLCLLILFYLIVCLSNCLFVCLSTCLSMFVYFIPSFLSRFLQPTHPLTLPYGQWIKLLQPWNLFRVSQNLWNFWWIFSGYNFQVKRSQFIQFKNLNKSWGFQFSNYYNLEIYFESHKICEIFGVFSGYNFKVRKSDNLKIHRKMLKGITNTLGAAA